MVDGEETQNEQTANGSRVREDGRESTGQGIAGQTQEGNRRKSRSGKMGFIYFIETQDGQYVKIGYSTNVYARLSRLGTLRPGSFGLRIMGSFPGTPATEKWLHDLFASERDNGEWFNFSEKLRVFIDMLRLTPPAIAVPSSKPHSTRPVGKTQSMRISSVASAWGRKGGAARAKALSKEQRKEIAKKAAEARWGKKK